MANFLNFETESTENLNALRYAYQNAFDDAYRNKDLIVGQHAQTALEEIDAELAKRNVSVFDDEQLQAVIDRYDELYTEALDKFEQAKMESILKLWAEAENEAMRRTCFKKVN